MHNNEFLLWICEVPGSRMVSFPPWPLWLSWLGVVQKTGRSQVRFPVRAHAWVAGSVPSQGAYERQPTSVSVSHRCFSPTLSPSLPFSLKKKMVPFPFCGNKGQVLRARQGPGPRWRGRIDPLHSCQTVMSHRSSRLRASPAGPQ